jgi:hypothetical protein
MGPVPNTTILRAPKAAARALGITRLRDHYLSGPPIDSFVGSTSPPIGGDMATLFSRHRGRHCTKWSQYFEVYDEVLAPYRHGFPLPGGGARPLRFLELGVYQGGSLELWREFLGADASIMGIDIDERCAGVGRADLPVRIGSQADREFLLDTVDELGGIDVVLDDGSHVAAHQRASFDVLFPLLTDGGLYIIEDVHTAYWREFGGGLRRPGTAIEVAKGLVDGMHAWYHRLPVGKRSSVAREEVRSVRFYDSIIVIEKRHHGRPQLLSIGDKTF